MIELACHYALVRFLPYREVGEFINIGVALACPATGFLDFAIERQKYHRVTAFFPELQDDASIYRENLTILAKELDSLSEQAKTAQQRQTIEPNWTLETFKWLTRPRETLFHFSTPRTVLTDDPARKLEKLFAYYVERQFGTTERSPEAQIR